MSPGSALSATDFHVLLVLQRGPRHGYAIRQAVDEESGGGVSPEIGSLYRVLARLVAQGWVRPVEAPEDDVHPGRERKYYGLTPEGAAVLRQEAARLVAALGIARARGVLGEGRT